MDATEKEPILKFSDHAAVVREQAALLGELSSALQFVGNPQLATRLAACAETLYRTADDMRRTVGEGVALHVRRADEGSAAVVRAALAGARIAAAE